MCLTRQDRPPTTQNGAGTRLELSLDIWRSVPPLMKVTAAVEVGSWCAVDHNMHAVQQFEWLIGSDSRCLAPSTLRSRPCWPGLTGPVNPPSGAAAPACRTLTDTGLLGQTSFTPDRRGVAMPR